MKITIKPVSTKSELTRFIKFPWKIYKNDPHWVPQLIMDSKKYLDRKKNPFFKYAEAELFIAYRGKEPIGTIGACVNKKHNEIHKDATGFFGFFESINDPSVSKLLFDEAGRWLKQKGMTAMRGPMNFSIHDPCGLLIDNFNSMPTIMMTYNPAYYVDLFNGYGFVKSADLYAYRWDIVEQKAHLKQIAKEVEAIPGIRIRGVNYSEFKKEAAFVRDLYNSAFSKNWGYMPITEEEFENSIKSMKYIIDPDLVYFAYVDDEIAGFVLPLPDVNPMLKKMNGRLFPTGIFRLFMKNRYINKIRVFALGVKPEFLDKRLGALLYYTFGEATLTKYSHYELAEASWINEFNQPMNRAMVWCGLYIYKTYRVYDYSIA